MGNNGRPIPVPGLWLAVGDRWRLRYPLFYCAAGNGNESGYELVTTFDPKFYELMCAAADAYNQARARERAGGE